MHELSPRDILRGKILEFPMGRSSMGKTHEFHLGKILGGKDS